MSIGRKGIEEATVGCDEIEAGLRRVRELLKNAKTYRKHAFYESFQPLYEDMMLALERTWMGFMTIREELPE